MKLDISDVVQFVATKIPRSKRYCALLPNELQEVWNLLHIYLQDRILNGKAVHVPGLGFFTIQQNKREKNYTTPRFIPAASWEAIPGFKVNRAVSKVTDATEPINYYAICQGRKYTRDSIEAAIKDIMHGFQINLKVKNELNVSCHFLGRLSFAEGQVIFKYSANFLAEFNEARHPKMPAIPRTAPTGSTQDKLENEVIVLPLATVSEAHETEEAVPNLDKKDLRVSFSAPNGQDIILPPVISAQTKFTIAEPTIGAAAVEQLIASHNRLSQKEAEYDQEKKERAIQFLANRQLGHHMHASSGNRMWTNIGCTICRTSKLPSIGASEQIAQKEREKYQDRLLLYLNIEKERETLMAEQAEDEAKAEAARKDAEANFKLAMEKSEQQMKDQQKEPMGNIFSIRRGHIDRPSERQKLAKDLLVQIKERTDEKEHANQEEVVENSILTENFAVDKQLALAEAFVENAIKKKNQLTALKSQIKERDDLKAQELKAKAEESTLYKENPFARSEALLEMYQKQKAKQLYQEQLAIVEQKKEYERKIAALEKGLSRERVSITKKSLEKELMFSRNAAFTGRKTLEMYWNEQLRIRKQLQNMEV